MSGYTPNPTELKTRASLFWPKELITEQERISIIPVLIKTQDRFISILDVADRRPDSWKTILRETEGLPANLFLKHLMVLTDVGGEPLKRLRPELARMFPDGKMVFEWKGKKHSYVFQKILSTRTLSNASLFVDGESLATGHELDAATEDVIMLLMFGAAAINASLPQDIAEKCMIGSLIGRKPEVQKFVKQRYIFVSRITSGARANSLGQLAQDYVRDMLLGHAVLSLRWVRTSLRNNSGFRFRPKVLDAFVVGSVAKGNFHVKSDLDIAVIIPQKKRVSALRVTERFHTRMAITRSRYPQFNGRCVDFQFFYAGDPALTRYSRIRLK